MCGIYITNKSISKPAVISKLKGIDFRGPDNLGYKKINDVSLGHLRLSILDLDTRSNQPMRYKNYYISYNGEIYNYLFLRQEIKELGIELRTESDTEVLLICYDLWKDKMLERINGMFSFCIYDAKNDTLFCGRDRLGVKPFYYHWMAGKIEVCSQLGPLIDQNSTIDKDALSIYLDCGYIPSPHSAIQGVKKLPPGNFMWVDLKKKSLEIKTYWDLKPIKVQKQKYEDAKSEIHDLLIDAVRIRLNSDVPLGSFLSGGIDSALVSAIASKISKNQINTFSVGFENIKYDESHIAEQYAKIIGAKHKTIKCRVEDILNEIPKHRLAYDEPFADSSALPSLLLNSVTKKHVTVALSGDGGDESFIGYNYFAFLMKNKSLFLIPYWIKSIIVRAGFLRLARKITGKSIPKELLQIPSLEDFVIYHFTLSSSISLSKKDGWLKEFKKYFKNSDSIIQKAADFNIKLWLENDSNVKVDRASMAYSVEVRSPFLDYRIIEKARELPVDYRYQKGRQKRILRDILKEYIPEEVFDQPKKGFGVPLDDWIRNELREDFEKKLSNDFLNIVPNLDINKFKTQMDEHMSGKKNHKTNIWKMYVLRQWYEEFGFYKAG